MTDPLDGNDLDRLRAPCDGQLDLDGTPAAASRAAADDGTADLDDYLEDDR